MDQFPFREVQGLARVEQTGGSRQRGYRGDDQRPEARLCVPGVGTWIPFILLWALFLIKQESNRIRSVLRKGFPAV